VLEGLLARGGIRGLIHECGEPESRSRTHHRADGNVPFLEEARRSLSAGQQRMPTMDHAEVRRDGEAMSLLFDACTRTAGTVFRVRPRKSRRQGCAGARAA